MRGDVKGRLELLRKVIRVGVAIHPLVPLVFVVWMENLHCIGDFTWKQTNKHETNSIWIWHSSVSFALKFIWWNSQTILFHIFASQNWASCKSCMSLCWQTKPNCRPQPLCIFCNLSSKWIHRFLLLRMKRYNCCKIKTWLCHRPAEARWEQAQRQEGLQACSNVCFTLGFANATNISYHNLMLVDVSWFHLKDVFYLIFKKRDVMPCRHGDPGGSVAESRTAPVLSWTLRRPELWAIAADLCWKIYPKVGNHRI